MQSTSVPFLLAAAGAVGFLHSILPDHWVPLAVIARTRRWTIVRTARISLLASVGHVLTSIILGGIIAGWTPRLARARASAKRADNAIVRRIGDLHARRSR